VQSGGMAKEKGTVAPLARLGWERRRALVCVTPAHREALAQQLADSNYQVFVADDTSQAIERMREEHMDVVILDPGFDPIEQGAAFVTREVNIMRPAERRRLFFVHLNASVRTLDAHAAFVNNVNLVINPADIEIMPQALERALRDFNELYREFNIAVNAGTI
jgi:CheY-like chemotaxis protein